MSSLLGFYGCFLLFFSIPITEGAAPSLAWHSPSSSPLAPSFFRSKSVVSHTTRIRKTFLTVRGGSDNANDENNIVQQPLGPVAELPEQWHSGRPKQGLILMDAFCPYFGLYMANRAKKVYGVAVIVMLSEYMKGYFAHEQPEDWRQYLPMAIPIDIKAWKGRLPCEEIIAVHVESDSGLKDGEQLALALNATCQNGINDARRDKFLMNQVMGSHGLPVARQKLCRTLNETLEFATELFNACTEEVLTLNRNENNDKMDTGLLGRGTNIPEQNNLQWCIVKPTRGVASENVHLCNDLESVQKAFEEIQGSSVFGAWEYHQSVLVQEFLAGTEYAVDIVSKNGEHKVAALWRYDKRPANGAPFCYYATELIDATQSQVGARICDYAKKSLDALNVKWGLSHTEIIMTANGPKLVEVNCRQHNMDFAPLTMACIGYNAFDMLLAAYLGGHPDHTYPPGTENERLDWDSLPDIPSLRAYGAMVHLVNSVEGVLSQVNMQHLNEIHNMESVLELEVYEEFLASGSYIRPTTDIRTDCGWAQLVNDDAEVFVRDYNRIVDLMPQLFEVERSAEAEISSSQQQPKEQNAADSAVQ